MIDGMSQGFEEFAHKDLIDLPCERPVCGSHSAGATTRGGGESPRLRDKAGTESGNTWPTLLWPLEVQRGSNVTKPQRSPLERTPSRTSSHAGTVGLALRAARLGAAGVPFSAGAGGCLGGCGRRGCRTSTGLRSRARVRTAGTRRDRPQRPGEVGVDQLAGGVVESASRCRRARRGRSGSVRRCPTGRPSRPAARSSGRPRCARRPSWSTSGSRPRATSAAVTVSSSVSTAGPSASTGCAAVASSAARERSSSTGWANRSTRAMSTPGRCGDLLDRCACADPGLDVLGAQHVWDLDVDLGLARRGLVAAYGGPQPVVGAQDELLPGVVGLADDALAVDVESDDLQFPHGDLLRAGAPGPISRSPYCVIGPYRADTRRASGCRLQSCSTTQSTHWVSALTSSGSTAGNMPTRSWLRPSLR